MAVYHVDWYYNKDGIKEYYVMPHSLKGTLLTYFGFDFRTLSWRVGFIPESSRLPLFIEWVKFSRFTEKAAQRVADELNGMKG